MQIAEQQSVKTACWSCGSALAAGKPFCDACGKVQPTAANVNYFDVFDLPKKLAIDTYAACDLEGFLFINFLTGFIHRPDEYGNGPVGFPDKAKPEDFDVVSSSIVDLAQQMGA